MDPISLISLVIDYEIPPSEILNAIEQRRLKPFALRNPPTSLKEISFAAEEVESVFWAYEAKYKAADQRAELVRRFNRYDAIVAGLIGSVAGSLATSIAQSLLSNPSQTRLADSGFGATVPREFPTRARIPGQPSPPQFRMPIDPAEADARVFSSRWWEMELMPHVASQSLRLMAAATGQFEDYGPSPDGVAEYPILVGRHGSGWATEYVFVRGTLIEVSTASRTQIGTQVASVSPPLNGPPVVLFRVLRETPDGDWEPIPAALVMDAPGRAPR